MVRLLLARRADVQSASKEGFTPLLWAAYRPNAAVVRLLLKYGANVNAGDHGGETPLMAAASTGIVNNVHVLLAANARIEDKDKESETALMRAARNAHAEVVAILLRAGASVNARNRYGQTPLLQAVSRPRSDGYLIHEDARIEAVARLLIANGAYVNAFDNNAHTALSLSKKNDRPVSAGILRNAGARESEEE